MSDLQIPGVDMEKLGEVMHETGLVKMDIGQEKLQEMKDKLVKEDSKYETVELWRLQGMFDLMNSVFVAVQNYHTKYGFDDKEVVKEEIKSQISSNNKEWHKLNRLRPFATIDEKVKRHIDHVANCKCGPIPRYVKKEIEKRLG